MKTQASASNPLLDFSDLPRFDQFDVAQIDPALDVLLEQARQALAVATDATTEPSWANVVEPLELATEQLGRAWGIVGHLSSVDDSPELREANNRNLPRVTQFWTELGQNEALFARYKALRDSAEFAQLSAPRQLIIEHALRDFRLGGAELKSPGRERFAQIQEQSATLARKFSENVLDSTNAFEHIVTAPEQLAGLPDDAIKAAAADAKKHDKQGYRFTLQFPSYLPVIQYADSRELRETLYRAYATLASAQAQAPTDEEQRARFDNSAVIDQILALRAEEAKLLGFESFAEVSLVPKMADSPTEVIAFLRDLAARARPFAERDLDEVRKFAAAELNLGKIAPIALRVLGHRGQTLLPVAAGVAGFVRTGREAL